MAEKTYQEIDIKINVHFLEKQVRRSSKHLEVQIQKALRVRFDHAHPEPMEVTEIETSLTNAHIRITTSVDWTKNEPDISNYIINKIKHLLPFGVASVELLNLREEAEIYAFNIIDLIKDIELDSNKRYNASFLGEKYKLLKEGFRNSENVVFNYRLIKKFVEENNSDYKLAKKLWDNREEKDVRDLCSFDFKTEEFVDLWAKNK